MPQFAYILSLTPPFQIEKNWTAAEEKIVSDHFDRLVTLREENVLILAGKTRYDVDRDENFGIVVFEADSPEAADAIMQSDPAVKQGLMTAELHPFNVALIKETTPTE